MRHDGEAGRARHKMTHLPLGVALRHQPVALRFRHHLLRQRQHGVIDHRALVADRAQAGFLGPATFAYIMARDESVDVDSPLDLEIAELLLARRDDAV